MTDASDARSRLGLLARLCACGGQPRPHTDPCGSVRTSVPVSRPDLAIYSQSEELAAGRQPRWDSPDITTNHWKPFRLMNEAKVVIRNLSPDTPAVNALVHYATSAFGIGTRSTLRQSRLVNLAPASSVELLFPLDSVTLAGDPRAGVHISIEHPHDANLINNQGSQVHDGSYTSEVGRTHTIEFPVFNNSGLSRTMTLSILPTPILGTVTPSSHTFAPFEQITARLEITVPGFLVGTAAAPINEQITVVSRLATGEVVGGLTKLLRIDT